MDHQQTIQDLLKKSIEAKTSLLNNTVQIQRIAQAAKLCIEALKNGKKILLAGNGGSAADAQHIAAELISRFELERRGLPAIALNTDSSILTAIGNDYSFQRVFARQIEALGQKGDVFIAISTSGKSENILQAVKTAKSQGLVTIGMTGNKKGPLVDQADLTIEAPSSTTARIQECHITIAHILCALIEERFLA